MGCKKCTTTPEIPREIKKVVLFGSHPYITEKFYNLFSQKFLIEKCEDCLIFSTNFGDLIKNDNLTEKFTEFELENINVFLMDKDEEIALNTLKKGKTLAYYIYLFLSSDLKNILDNESIITLFQPIIDAQSMNVVAFECLSRGLQKDGSFAPPTLMFELAKKADLLFNLDRQCRMQSLRSARLHNIEKMIFINFTPSSIYNPEFCLQDTFKLAKELNYDPSKIVFEVIESEKVLDVNHLKSILKYYSDFGFKVALDDVGAGYSSLNMIAELKPNVIKIDMNLIKNIHTDQTKKVIVNSLITISKEIGAVTLAEGVEKEEEFKTIKDLGIDLAQGFLFGQPSQKPIFNVPRF